MCVPPVSWRHCGAPHLLACIPPQIMEKALPASRDDSWRPHVARSTVTKSGPVQSIPVELQAALSETIKILVDFVGYDHERAHKVCTDIVAHDGAITEQSAPKVLRDFATKVSTHYESMRIREAERARGSMLRRGAAIATAQSTFEHAGVMVQDTPSPTNTDVLLAMSLLMETMRKVEAQQAAMHATLTQTRKALAAVERREEYPAIVKAGCDTRVGHSTSELVQFLRPSVASHTHTPRVHSRSQAEIPAFALIRGGAQPDFQDLPSGSECLALGVAGDFVILQRWDGGSVRLGIAMHWTRVSGVTDSSV